MSIQRALACVCCLLPLVVAVPAVAKPRPGPAAGVDVPEGQRVPGSTAAPNVVVPGATGFDGIAATEAGGVLPPDPVGDVGPNHYVQATNAVPGGARYAVYGKTGTLLGAAPLTDLFSSFPPASADTPPLKCANANQAHGDPIVLYDEAADRWVITQFAFATTTGIPNPPFKQCIAVSQTGDPLGLWRTYEFTITDGVGGHVNYLPDYPKLAVWNDAYTLTANAFDINQTTGAALAQGAFLGAFNRDDLLNGAATPRFVVRFADESDVGSANANDIPYGALPADVDGGYGGRADELPPAGTGGLFAFFTDDNFGQSADALHVFELDVDWTGATSTLTRTGPLAVAAFDSALCSTPGGLDRSCVPQPGGGPGLDPIAGQLMFRAAYRNRGGTESIVLNHVVDASGGLGQNHVGIRWYELRRNVSAAAWAVGQAGTHAPDADHRFIGSAAMDRGGNIALGYSVAGPATSPSLRFTGRYAGSPGGTLPLGEAALAAGGGVQQSTTSRYGDYSSLSVDPVDGCTFWFTGEYYAATSAANWRTRIGTFALVDDPQLAVTTHTAGQWSSRPEIAVATSGAAANCGLAGYSYVWDAAPATVPDATVEAPASASSIAGTLVEGAPTYLHLRAVDLRGNAAPGVTVGPFPFDATPPAGVALAGAGLERAFRTSLRIPIRLAASDASSGIAALELRTRSAPHGGDFAAPTAQVVTGSTTVVDAEPGRTYCFALVARDLAGNTASTTADRCAAIPLDDRALARSGDFRQARRAGAYRATVTTGSETGSIVLRRSLVFRRLAVVATRCPGCGRVAVYVNGVRVRRLDLDRPALEKRVVIPVGRFAKLRRGAVAIEILSDGRPVEIDGLAVSRV